MIKISFNNDINMINISLRSLHSESKALKMKLMWLQHADLSIHLDKIKAPQYI